MSRTRASRLPLVAILAAVLVAPTGALAAEPPAAAGSLDVHRFGERPSPAAGTDRLIVKYVDGTSGAARAAIRQAEALDMVRSMHALEADVVRPRGRSLEAAIAALEKRPQVDVAVIDYRRTSSIEPTGEPGWAEMWGLHNSGQVMPGPPYTDGTAGVSDVDIDGLEALRATAGATPIVVAVIDDGVDFGHPELAARPWTNPGEIPGNLIDDDLNGYQDDVHGWDFCHQDASVHDLPPNGVPVGEFDPIHDFHGTAVAGTIASSVNGAGTVGIAPYAQVMALKFLDGVDDCGYDSEAIEAIAYARHFGVRIINASWGGPGYNQLLKDAIDASGALFVAAAGNGGADSIGDNLETAAELNKAYPAQYNSANILSVAAVNHRGQLSTFSNYGKVSVDLAAPGELIVAPVPYGEFEGDYYYMDGTSFAAPYVSGVAALVSALSPSLLANPVSMRSRLLTSGAPLASTVGKTYTGKLLNARRAIDFTIPVLAAAPRLAPLAGKTLGTSSMWVRLSWSAATDDVAMGSYRVEVRANGGSWQVLTTGTTAAYWDLVAVFGTAYEFRVFPRDAAGNFGAASPLLAVKPSLAQESSTLVAYAGTWTPQSSSTASGGAVRYTTAWNAASALTFTGRGAAIIMPTSATRASVKIYIDGVYKTTVSLYSATAVARKVVYATTWPTAGKHQVKLVNTPVSGRYRSDIDAWAWLN